MAVLRDFRINPKRVSKLLRFEIIFVRIFPFAHQPRDLFAIQEHAHFAANNIRSTLQRETFIRRAIGELKLQPHRPHHLPQSPDHHPATNESLTLEMRTNIFGSEMGVFLDGKKIAGLVRKWKDSHEDYFKAEKFAYALWIDSEVPKNSHLRQALVAFGISQHRVAP